MTDYKQLCAELLQELESSHDDVGLINNRRISLINRTRAALAEPQPESPTQRQLLQLAAEFWPEGAEPTQAVPYARAVLARWASSGNY